MKILMLIDGLGVGGAETHTVTLARSLQKSGNEITVLSSGGCLMRELRQSGVKHKRIPNVSVAASHDEAPFSIRSAVARCIIEREIRTFRPNIVHAHTRTTAFLAYSICKKEKIPLAVTAHAKFSTNGVKGLLSRWGDGTISVSEDIKKHLISNAGVDPSRIKTVLNGVFIP